jgi:hypothetical protein
MRQGVYILFSLWILSFKSQSVVISGLPYFYTQTFGLADITTWVNDDLSAGTFSGWYIGAGNWNGHANIFTPGGTSLSTLNAGGYYNYECSNDNNQKIGSRASNTAPSCNYGVTFRNLTGSTISTVFISYTAFQFTIGQNINTPNTLTTEYSISNVLFANPVTATAFTSINTALNYLAPQNDPGPGNSGQVGYLSCNTASVLSYCLDLSASPLLNNQFITIRWNDVNDAFSDHNMGIDNVFIGFANTSCAIVLADDDIILTEKKENNKSFLNWQSNTIDDYKSMRLERSVDGVNFETVIDGDYRFTEFEVSNDLKLYYRVKGLKWNEEERTSNIVLSQNSLTNECKHKFSKRDNKTIVSLSNNEAIVGLKIYNLNGTLLYQSDLKQKEIAIDNDLLKGEQVLFYTLPEYHLPIKQMVLGRF